VDAPAHLPSTHARAANLLVPLEQSQQTSAQPDELVQLAPSEPPLARVPQPPFTCFASTDSELLLLVLVPPPPPPPPVSDPPPHAATTHKDPARPNQISAFFKLPPWGMGLIAQGRGTAWGAFVAINRTR
jgi:hypothetical protein